MLISAVPDEASDPLDVESGLRIGLFSESFHPVQNGVTTAVLTLVAQLRALNHRVWVFAPAHEDQPRPELNVLRFPSFVSAFNREYPLAYPFLPRLALSTHFVRLRLDVVHTHTPFVLGLTGANLAIRRTVPLVSTFHTFYSRYSHYMPFLPDSVTQNLIDHYLPWYYNRCERIICPSEVAHDAIRTMGVERPVDVIPTGIPIPAADNISAEASRKARLLMGIPVEAPVILYAGRLAAEKNVRFLLEVLCQVRARRPDAFLVLAGSGPLQEQLAIDAEDLGLSGCVRFLGSVPRKEMDAVYAAANVFCFPSATETQGLVVGEARAAGLPVVVADAGGAPETILHGVDGFRVEPGNAFAFSAHILRVMDDESLARSMRAGCRRRALEFTPDALVGRVLAVYELARTEPQAARPQVYTLEEEMEWEAVGQSMCENTNVKPPSIGNPGE